MKTKHFKGFSSAKPFCESRRAGSSPSFLPSFLIIIFTLLLFSCKKEIPNSPPEAQKAIQLKYSEEEVQVVDGVLCFIDAQTMNNYLKLLMEMPDSLRKIQEAAWGFTSYATLFDSINDYIAAASSENEMLQRIAANEDFVKVEDSTLVSQLPSFGHHYLANADGIFRADSTFYRIFDQGIAAWRGATLNQMKNLTLNEDFDEDPSDGKFFYLKEATIEPTESDCGNTKSAQKSNNNNNRRVSFEIKVMKRNAYSTTCYSPQRYGTPIEHALYTTVVKIVPQKKVVLFWFKYKTDLWFSELYSQLMVLRQDGYIDSLCKTIPRSELGGLTNMSGVRYNDNELEDWIEGANVGMGDMMHNIPLSQLSSPVFLKVKGKGRSKELGSNQWAEISCGY